LKRIALGALCFLFAAMGVMWLEATHVNTSLPHIDWARGLNVESNPLGLPWSSNLYGLGATLGAVWWLALAGPALGRTGKEAIGWRLALAAGLGFYLYACLSPQPARGDWLDLTASSETNVTVVVNGKLDRRHWRRQSRMHVIPVRGQRGLLRSERVIGRIARGIHAEAASVGATPPGIPGESLRSRLWQTHNGGTWLLHRGRVLAAAWAAVLALALCVPRRMPRLALCSTIFARLLVFVPTLLNLALLMILATGGLTDGLDERGALWVRSLTLLLVGVAAEAASRLWGRRE
jgi:hypothetical protein